LPYGITQCYLLPDTSEHTVAYCESVSVPCSAMIRHIHHQTDTSAGGPTFYIQSLSINTLCTLAVQFLRGSGPLDPRRIDAYDISSAKTRRSVFRCDHKTSIERDHAATDSDQTKSKVAEGRIKVAVRCDWGIKGAP